MAEPPGFDPKIAAYYALGLEASRLDQGYFPLEEARTRELVLRHLFGGPLRVLDVGGGSGRYALWLAELGHEVELVDPVPLHVTQALSAAARAPGHLARARVGDARALECDNSVMDAVLLLGPLYHLPERADRLQALREARRVLKPGGLLFAAAISRFASLFDWIASGPLLADAEFREIAFADVRHGHHRNDTGRPQIFTTAFFHRPEELREEILEAGLALQDLVAIEGPGAQVRGFAEAWADPALRDALLQAVRIVEREPALLGASPHLMAIARV